MNIISPKAQIGKNVVIEPFTVIHDNVVIGDNCTIQSHCDIGRPTPNAKGKPLIIGANSTIRSNSVLYQGSEIGNNLQTGHHVLIRENTLAGKFLQLGSYASIEGDCEIGNYNKFHSYVNVAQAAKIGSLVWLFPHVQFTNDKLPPSGIEHGIEIDDLVVVATNTLLLPGVKIGLGAFVPAGSIVKEHVPARKFYTHDQEKIEAQLLYRMMGAQYQYPWPKFFRDGYPEEAYALMDELIEKIENL